MVTFYPHIVKIFTVLSCVNLPPFCFDLGLSVNACPLSHLLLAWKCVKNTLLIPLPFLEQRLVLLRKGVKFPSHKVEFFFAYVCCMIVCFCQIHWKGWGVKFFFFRIEGKLPVDWKLQLYRTPRYYWMPQYYFRKSNRFPCGRII